jgi:hypothetical protein
MYFNFANIYYVYIDMPAILPDPAVCTIFIYILEVYINIYVYIYRHM